MAGPRRGALWALFALIAVGFAGVAVWAGTARQWIVLAAAAALAVWMGELTYRSLKR
ncbi:MAG: hypothetical protein R3C15_23520 [Thermoleophilia bacterium]